MKLRDTKEKIKLDRSATRTSVPEDTSAIDTAHEDAFVPPDGGARAWCVMVASFMCNGIIFGIMNSFGTVYVELKNHYESEGDADSSTKASLVGSLAMGTTFLLSPVSGILVDRFGIQQVSVAGGLIATLGMVLSSFFWRDFKVLCFTYGFLFGCGSSLAYTPSLVILGHYFRRRIGMINGIVTAGSSIFTIVFLHALHSLFRSLGISATLLVLSAFTAGLIVAGLVFRPLMPRRPEGACHASKESCFRRMLYVDNWHNPRYVIWALAIPLALFGYFVPYVYIVDYVHRLYQGEKSGEAIITCIAITSGLGRFGFGKLADNQRVNRIRLQQLCFLVVGVCTMLLPVAPYLGDLGYPALMAISLVLGAFDGCFIAVLGPIAFDICGPRGASQGLGFVLGMCSIPLATGPPIAGMLYTKLGNSYTIPFVCAGIPPLVGSAVICLVQRVQSRASGPKGTCSPDLSPRAGNNNDQQAQLTQPFLLESEADIPQESFKPVHPSDTATTDLTDTVGEEVS